MSGVFLKRILVLLVWLTGAVWCVHNAAAFDRSTSASLSHYIMGGIYEKKGDVPKAIQYYQKALKADPRNPAILINLASAYLKQGDTAQAIDSLDRAVKLDPDAVEPHAVLALLYFSQEKLSEAGKEYERALENASKLEPKNIGIYKSLGLLYLQQKNYAAAEKTYRLILSMSADDVDAHFFLANILDETKNRPAAVKELKKVLELDPEHHQALNYLGYIYVEENQRLDEAQRMIARALELDPENGAYTDSLGWLYFKQGKHRQALALLEKAAKIVEDPIIFDHLGDAYFKSGDKQKARMYWEKSLVLNADQQSVKQKIEKLGSPR